ncbi:flagellar biosynthesis regulator FlaF, partial [Stenotrophomonas maltophilia]
MRSAANAYARAANSALTAREAESAVLIKAAQQLQLIKDDWANQSAGLNRALSFNQKVWTVIAGAVSEPDNPLPADVKSNVA